MKTGILFDHGGGELANQLWNYASIYAYGKESGVEIDNPAFFEYASYFKIAPTQNFFIKNIFIPAFKGDTRRKQSVKKRFWRNVYRLYIYYCRIFHKSQIVSSLNSKNKPVYLPPSHATETLERQLEKNTTTYFSGWLFRNPIGLEKYRLEIKNYFQPKLEIENMVTKTISELRQTYSHVVGVHIRQGDYKAWKGGIYFIDQKRVREILDEYLQITNKNKESVHFVFTSDGGIQQELFSDLNITISKNDMVTDLFLLSSCDIVLGSDSSFGDFAAYYGNIPHIIFKTEPIDWEYYKQNLKFFWNKYCTMVHY